MSGYRIEWDCCGDETYTQAWIPEECPFCESHRLQRELAAAKAEIDHWRALGLPSLNKGLIHGLNDEGFKLLGKKEDVEHFKKEYESAKAEIERLQADNNHQRERRNAARECIEKMKAEIERLLGRVEKISSAAWAYMDAANDPSRRVLYRIPLEDAIAEAAEKGGDDEHGIHS